MERKTILAIEDDLEICTLYKFLMEKEGYFVKEAHSGREALVALGLEDVPRGGDSHLVNLVPDLILLDIMLPEIDGYTVLSKILQNDALKEIPVIVVTAKSRMSDLFSSSPNVKAFFSKPFEPKLIRAKIKEILG
jgi:CheY-like chemotaxis protein